MKQVLKTVLILMVIAAGLAEGQTVPALDAKTRAMAEETLARGVAWLQMQQGADGRIGSNANLAVTALALRAVRNAGGGSSEFRDQGSKGEAKTEWFLKNYLAGNPTNLGLVALNVDVCRRVLHLPGSVGQFDGASALAYQDRDDSARAREFELREIAWRKQRAELVKQGQDPDRFAAASLALAAVPGAVAAGGDRGPRPAVAATASGGSGPSTSLRVAGPALPGSVAKSKRRRGYGNLTYDGMMRLLYDDVRGNDPRVDAIMDWAERGWSLDENPGKGTAGLFYFWHAMVKCLAASGEEEIVPLLGGTPIRWREEFVRKLVALQRVDGEKKAGYWVNENTSYMEDDPVLVTAYAMLSLEYALGKRE